MSACALRRWGSGTSCERPADTPAAKEMAARLAAMQAERQRQDTALYPPLQEAAAAKPQAQARAGPQENLRTQ